MATQSDGQRGIHQLHLIQVYRLEVSSHRGIQLLFIQQRIHIDTAVNKRVMAVGINNGMAVLHTGLCRHISKVPSSVAQLMHLGIGL